MSRFRDVVARHHRDSDGVLVAGREPCITIAHDEKRSASGRSFRIVPPAEVGALRLRPSWCMAVLLCPGDMTDELAKWRQAHPRRMQFYLHPDTDAVQALAAWREAGHAVMSTWTVTDWKRLHRHFGAHWNVRIFDDFR